MALAAKEPEHYVVRNWAQFQHYKDRNPTWIKMHFALLASEDWVMLDDASRLLAVVCMLVASRHDGRVPNKPAYLKRIAYLDQQPNLRPLISCGFLSEPLAVDSAEQADARPEAETDNKGETEKKEQKEGRKNAPTDFAFIGKVIRLTVKDFDRWRQNYPRVPDFIAELTKADDYYSEHPPEKGWFFQVSRWLAKANADAVSKPAQILDREGRSRDDPMFGVA